MAKFLKDALYPGTYRLLDGRTVTYTRDDVRHLSQRAKEMVAAGLSVPVAWNHQEDAQPLTEAEMMANKAKFNLGFVERADPDPSGFLSVLLDVPSDDDARRLPAARFVSPQIETDYVDGTGRLWPGLSITHLAVTARPVQPGQKPFQPVQMSRESKAGRGGKSRVWLSLEGYSMADDDKDKKDKPAKKEGEAGEDYSADGPDLKDVLEKLTSYGIPLPDDTSDENFLERLRTALVALGGKESEEETAPEESETAGLSAGPPPVAMSMEALTSRLLKQDRERLSARIKALLISGRVTKPIHDKLVNESKTVKLSLDKSGELKSNGLLAKIEAYEQLDAGHTGFVGGKRDRLSQDTGGASGLTAVDPPADQRAGPQTEKQVNEVVDQIDVMMGRRRSAS